MQRQHLQMPCSSEEGTGTHGCFHREHPCATNLSPHSASQAPTQAKTCESEPCCHHRYWWRHLLWPPKPFAAGRVLRSLGFYSCKRTRAQHKDVALLSLPAETITGCRGINQQPRPPPTATVRSDHAKGMNRSKKKLQKPPVEESLTESLQIALEKPVITLGCFCCKHSKNNLMKSWVAGRNILLFISKSTGVKLSHTSGTQKDSSSLHT